MGHHLTFYLMWILNFLLALQLLQKLITNKPYDEMLPYQ